MQTIEFIDSHTEGEPTRTIVGGAPDLGDGPMAQRRRVLQTQHDWLRRALILEPRGCDWLVGALLVEPVDPACAAGVIFFNNAGYLGMCGLVERTTREWLAECLTTFAERLKGGQA